MIARVRPAILDDVPSMHRIRLSVSENLLDAGTSIDQSSYAPFVKTGSCWVAENDKGVIGFAAVDPLSESVWALFVDPAFEKQGVGRALHGRMLDWARGQGLQRLMLATGPGTRAERFYRRLGWQETGVNASGEVQFERGL